MPRDPARLYETCAGLPMPGAIQRLQESADRYRRLFEESLDPIYVSRTDGTLVEINRAGLDLFGLSREEVAGLDARELYEDPADRSRFQRLIHEYGEVKGFEVRLRTRDGEVLDCVLNATARRDLEGEVVAYQGIIRDVTERNRLEERLRVQALRDPLTELPNRTLLWDRLQGAIARADRNENTIAVLFIDVDRFKAVNDGLGHTVGDQVLREVARRLLYVTRETDTVARVGGDEFAILLEAARGPDEVDMVAKRIETAFAEPFQAGEEPIRLSVSIGGTLRFPHTEDGLGARPADELVRRADVAMYAAKDRAGTAYVSYDPRRDPRQQDRLGRERAFHSAIESRQLVLHYQPIVRMSTGRVGAVEALVRWSHPVQGLLTPDQSLRSRKTPG